MAPHHFGLFCIQGTGHLYPMAAVGRTLMARGHRVTCFQDVRARALLRAAGVAWHPLGNPSAVSARVTQGDPALRPPLTRDLMQQHADVVLAEASAAVMRTGVDALIIDQGDLASSSVAERLRLPFVTLSFFPPIFLDSEIPPSVVGWDAGDGPLVRLRNVIANRLLTRGLAPIVTAINERRRTWGLAPFRRLNDVFSRRAIIAQLPECLEFPRRRKPPHLHYAGPFQDGRGRYALDFPWQTLTDRPLVYASMGTIRNRVASVFHDIAAACASFPVQLVISLGGGLDPADFGDLPGRPIVVQYAPQLELLKRASVTITHAGLNTTLESLSNGVPMVALPVTDDQPGVAARIKRAGAGEVIPVRQLTAPRLRRALATVTSCPQYRSAAGRLRQQLQAVNGAERAADIIERVIVQ
jgi:zeaxanthin glucosyltransferase